ncbi:uncharacterized protein RAG0_00886 [Rhynchosporium agropyri]|uniref:Uncharacterized protein n=1 Tax=Rhynchosporium agropyri TaxID=914238 RepID=A0A1E1JZ17_9HELO|nr:uncharacterized protein RAG0_00886 [Rhynchosporium agropyri]
MSPRVPDYHTPGKRNTQSQVVSVGNPQYLALLDLKTKSYEIHHEVCLLYQIFVA